MKAETLFFVLGMAICFAAGLAVGNVFGLAAVRTPVEEIRVEHTRTRSISPADVEKICAWMRSLEQATQEKNAALAEAFSSDGKGVWSDAQATRKLVETLIRSRVTLRGWSSFIGCSEGSDASLRMLQIRIADAAFSVPIRCGHPLPHGQRR